jgi:hypothetical protein
MRASALTSREAVLRAVDEFERLGRDRFLAQSGFHHATGLYLRYRGKRYDSKAIVGVALGYQFGRRHRQRGRDFTGGVATVATTLNRLGFVVIDTRDEATNRRQDQSRPFDPSRKVSSYLTRPKTPETEEEAAARCEKANVRHHELLVALHGALLAAGWQGVSEFPRSIDLIGTPPDAPRVLFEAKTLTDTNQSRQVRSGLAQLLEYRFQQGKPDDALCLITDTPIISRRGELLRSLGIDSIWTDGQRIKTNHRLIFDSVALLTTS